MKEKFKPFYEDAGYEFIVYSNGICAASVCTSLSVKEATRRINLVNPTGISSRWKPSKESFRTGESNPCQCEEYPKTHRHILFVC